MLLVERGFAESREKARSLVMAGLVKVGGHLVDKPGKELPEDVDIHLAGQDIPYVSRAGLKLEKALREFAIDVRGKTAIDIGASTGGFTDCLLQHGAEKIYAVDVGYGQIHWRLRQDERVVNLERTNIRYLGRDALPKLVDIAVIDVSFISLKMVIPKVLEFLSPDGILVALVKPQFEVGKGEVGKGGIVRDEEKHRRVLDDLGQFVGGLGLGIIGIDESPILGAKGNREFLMALCRGV